MKIQKPNITITAEEYWRMHAEAPPLPLLERPCWDCAMVTGFYTEYAEELLEQPPDVQERVRRSRFCHNHPDRACKGLDEYMEAKV